MEGPTMRIAKGYGLTELIVTTTLIGSLLALALPAFGNLIDQTRANAVAQRLQVELALAREAALFQRRHITFCRSDDQRHCATVGAWSRGTMTFEDRNNNLQREPHEPLLRTTQAADYHGLHLIDHSVRRHIRFRPDGRSAGTNLTLRLCAKNLAPLRLVVINTGGRVRLVKPSRDTPRCGSGTLPN